MSTEHTSDRFMNTVRKACSTPAGRSDLARGLATLSQSLDNPHCDTGESRWPLYVHLMPNGGIPGKDAESEIPYLLVAALYAKHDAPNPRMTSNPPPPQNVQPWQNLGWSYRQAVKRSAITTTSAEQALSTLCGLDRNALMRELPHSINRLRSANVIVAWAPLLRDLLLWPNYTDSVRRNWARGFHHFPKGETA